MVPYAAILSSSHRSHLEEVHFYLTRYDASHWGVTSDLHSHLLSEVEDNIPIARHGGVATSPVVILLYLHPRMEQLGLGKLFSDKNLWDQYMPDHVRQPLLTFKNGDPIAMQFCNYAAVAKMDTPHINNILQAPCVCGNHGFKPYVEPHCGHVITTNTSILRNAKLAALWAKGAKFRIDPHSLPEEEENCDEDMDIIIFRDVRRALRQWHKGLSQAQHNANTRRRAEQWLSAVTQRAKQLLTTNAQSVATPHNSPYHLLPADLKRLAWIKRNFVITTVDKAAQNMVLVCRKHYIQSAMDELQNGVAYTPSHQNADNIISNGSQFCTNRGIKPLAEMSIPNFHLRVKLHKSVPSFRFVAGSQHAPLTPVSRWLTLGLNAIMDEVHDAWAEVTERIPGAESKKCWIVNDSVKVAKHLKHINASRPNRTGIIPLQTFDFTSMYTTLPLHGMKEHVGMCIRYAFAQHRDGGRSHVLLLRKNKTYEWLNKKPTPEALKAEGEGKAICINVDEFCELLNELIDNTFVSFGGTIWHQQVGIPMGTPCAGQIANLYCYVFELNFLRRTIRHKNYELAKQLLNIMRYIDDLFVPNMPNFERIMYREPGKDGIYPKNLLALQKADSGTTVPYLDLSIQQNRRRGLFCGIYDKRLDSKYDNIQVIRYPDMESILAIKSKSNVLTGQLHRFARICSRSQDFIFQTAVCIHRMLSKRYPHQWIWPQMRRFLAEHPKLFGGKPQILWIHKIQNKIHQLSTNMIRAGPFGQILSGS